MKFMACPSKVITTLNHEIVRCSLMFRIFSCVIRTFQALLELDEHSDSPIGTALSLVCVEPLDGLGLLFVRVQWRI